MKTRYDVIIVGGGTAGCAAAYTAGKLGFTTLLIEKNIHLGGSITSGLVVPAMKSSVNQINTDFYHSLIKELQKIGAQVTYQGNQGWFNPELCKIALDRLMRSANTEVLFDTILTGVKYFENKLKGVTLTSNTLSVYIEADYFVDATGNCEIGVLANCNFLDMEKNNFQPSSLRFEMSGIDIKTFSDWLLGYDNDRNITAAEVINGQIHLSTAYTNNGKWALAPLFEDAVNKKILKDFDRNYFQVFTIPNMPSTLAFNCPRIPFNVLNNPLDNLQISKALPEARESILRLANFCKIYFPGFEKSYISNIADSIGIRVSRRIKGKYIYTVDDLKSGKTFNNPILRGNYPIDIHSDYKDESVLEHTAQDYYLPAEALMSADFDNLFIAGRCLSADFHAQAALRIQPSCFSMGEGIIKHIFALSNPNS